MHPILASHFLAGSILTLVLPVGLLIAVGVYWALLLRRRSAGARSEKIE
jgi:uncharacterized membrane protein YdfJ with MMPL/SSD domain